MRPLLNRGQTQYALQKYTKAETLDSHFIIKLNPRTIFNIADTCKAKYIVLAQTTTFCAYVKEDFLNLKKMTVNDSIYFVPLLHDFENNVKQTVFNSENYNQNKELFFSDRIYFESLNPHRSFETKVLTYYFPKFNYDTFQNNIYMDYKEKKIIFVYNNVTDSISFSELISNAKEIEAKIYFPPNLSKEIINQDFKDNPIK